MNLRDGFIDQIVRNNMAESPDEFADNAMPWFEQQLRDREVATVERCAMLHESINPASDSERLKGFPGAGAMGAVIEYRDAIRAVSPNPHWLERKVLEEQLQLLPKPQGDPAMTGRAAEVCWYGYQCWLVEKRADLDHQLAALEKERNANKNK